MGQGGTRWDSIGCKARLLSRFLFPKIMNKL